MGYMDKKIIQEIENKEPPKGGSLLVSTDEIKRLFDLIPKGSLYLPLYKEHLDPDNKLSDKEWEDFVDEGNSILEIVKTLFYHQTNVVNQVGCMNRSSRKCWTYSYRGNEETFLDLSCKKSPLTTTKQLPKWIK